MNTPNDNTTVTFVDDQGRRVVIKNAPPPPSPSQITEADTNLVRRTVDARGKEQLTAITLRDDSVQDILERVPAYLTRYGSALVCCVLFVVLLAIGFVRYPETVEAEARLVASHTSLNQPLPAQMIPLVGDGDRVTAGTPIAYHTGRANYVDVTEITGRIDEAVVNSETINIRLPERPLQLGTLQLPYETFRLSLERYGRQGTRLAFLEALSHFENLKEAGREWTEDNTLTARGSGTIALTAGGIEIVPEQDTEFRVEVMVDAATRAALRPGQKVVCELLRYPKEEYGVLQGQVSGLSPSAEGDGNYLVSVSLPADLTTTTGFSLPYEPALHLRARIITKEESLLQTIL